MWSYRTGFHSIIFIHMMKHLRLCSTSIQRRMGDLFVHLPPHHLRIVDNNPWQTFLSANGRWCLFPPRTKRPITWGMALAVGVARAETGEQRRQRAAVLLWSFVEEERSRLWQRMKRNGNIAGWDYRVQLHGLGLDTATLRPRDSRAFLRCFPPGFQVSNCFVLGVNEEQGAWNDTDVGGSWVSRGRKQKQATTRWNSDADQCVLDLISKSRFNSFRFIFWNFIQSTFSFDWKQS